MSVENPEGSRREPCPETDEVLGGVVCSKFAQEGWPDPVREAAPVSCRTEEDSLPGTERLSSFEKFWFLHPHLLLGLAGYLAVFMVESPFLPSAVFLWTVLAMGSWFGKGTARRGVQESPLSPPSEGLKSGYRAIGFATLAATLAGLLGPQGLAFYVLNGSWLLFSMAAVIRASRTDAQTGWMTGATSMGAACTFFGLPLAFVPGMPWPVTVLPLLSAGVTWQSWKFLSNRGQKRTTSALKALALASLATVFYLPSAVLTGFSFFEAACHLSVVIASVLIPLGACLDRFCLPSAASVDCLPVGAGDAPRDDRP